LNTRRTIVSNTAEVVQLGFEVFRIHSRALHLAPLNATWRYGFPPFYRAVDAVENPRYAFVVHEIASLRPIAHARPQGNRPIESERAYRARHVHADAHMIG